jgi:hypothetical protein
MDKKANEIMSFLHTKVFDPILNSSTASNNIKQGVRLTIMRLNEKDAYGMIKYFWSAIVGTENSKSFARKMKNEGFNRFEEVLEEFRDKFTDRWLNS